MAAFKPKPDSDPENDKPVDPELTVELPEFEDYQRKMESQWESTKDSYQQKINQIMDEFLKQNLSSIEPDVKDGEAKKEGFRLFDKDKPEKKSARMKNILSKAESALRGPDDDFAFFPRREKESVINIDWHGSRGFSSFWKISVGALVSLAAAAALYVSLFRIPMTTPLPYPHTGGIVLYQGKIYVADWLRKDLFVHDMVKSLPIVAVEPLPNEYITGFAMSSKKIWTSDGFNHQLLEHSLSSDHTVIKKITAPGPNPVGLFFDGKDLWSMDDQTKMLYRHKENDLEEIIEQYSMPKNTLTAFVIHNNRLWTLDRKGRRVTVFRLEEPVRELATYDLDPFLNGAAPTGIAIDEKVIWLTTENPARVIHVSIDRLMKTKTDL